MSYRIGIDVGGTFTDLVLTRPDGSHPARQEPDHARRSVGRRRSTASRCSPSGEGLVAAGAAGADRSRRARHDDRRQHDDRDERRGHRTDHDRGPSRRDRAAPRLQGRHLGSGASPPPPPIAPRRRRIGVPERLDYEGAVVTPLDEDAVRAALRRLKQQGIESLAVVFMFSFVNPAHERRVREIAAEECPGLHGLALARGDAVGARVRAHQHDAGQRIRRAEDRPLPAAPGRSAARRRLRARAAGDAIERRHHDAGVHPAPAGDRRSAPGPTGGVIAACAVAARAQTTDFVCADMGGTSYDVCLIRGGQPEIKAGWNWHHRYLIGLPMVDIHSIGAGGGSIASVVAGALQVGPAQRRRAARPDLLRPRRHASRPSPTPTCCSAISMPATSAAARMRLETEGVGEAIAAQIGRPLGLDTDRARRTASTGW